jgi:hypothetical protein
MTTSLTSTSRTADRGPGDLSVRRRPPAGALVAGVLTLLVGLVGSYGAVYFSSLDGLDDEGLTFLFVYVPVAVFGVVAAIALFRGHETGRLGVLSFALWLSVFNAFKIFYIDEGEAIPFGVVGLVILAGILSPATRRWTRRS